MGTIRRESGEQSLRDALAFLNRVRLIQTCAGVQAYDEPEIVGTELCFRLGYYEGIAQGWSDWTRSGEWSAYIVDGKSTGRWDAYFSKKRERSVARDTELKASFTRLEDAAKFVAMSVGDSVRTKLRLQTLFIRSRSDGLDDRLVEGPPSEADFAHVCGIQLADSEPFVRQHLKKIALAGEPSAYAVGFPGIVPYLKVLPQSNSEVENSLIEGVSPEVCACIVTGASASRT